MDVRVPGLPVLGWTNGEGEASYDAGSGELVLTAAGGADWTNDATGGAAQHRAALLGFPAPPGDFTLAARISVDAPRSTFDAGALAVWVDADHWAKVCFERSPAGTSMVVSVVTNTWSDDCNSTTVTGGLVHLRLARVGAAFAFHASSDGRSWDFVRLFRLDTDAPAVVGFLAQAPTGPSCTVRFDQVQYTDRAPGDLRDGT